MDTIDLRNLNYGRYGYAFLLEYTEICKMSSPLKNASHTLIKSFLISFGRCQLVVGGGAIIMLYVIHIFIYTCHMHNCPIPLSDSIIDREGEKEWKREMIRLLCIGHSASLNGDNRKPTPEARCSVAVGKKRWKHWINIFIHVINALEWPVFQQVSSYFNAILCNYLGFPFFNCIFTPISCYCCFSLFWRSLIILSVLS